MKFVYFIDSLCVLTLGDDDLEALTAKIKQHLDEPVSRSYLQDSVVNAV